MNKIIYSLKVMEELVKRGYIPLVSMPNPKFPRYQCWIFAATGSFMADLDQILSSLEGGGPHE